MLRCYLAGPDVFHPDMQVLAQGKRDLCHRYGILGCFPLDNAVDLTQLSGRDAAAAIYHANIALIESCDLLIANLTPFRGVSADPGTVFELGYMAARGQPVAAYSLDDQSYPDRVRQLGWSNSETKSAQDKDGQTIEDFGLTDNLMLAGPLLFSDKPNRWILRRGDWRNVADHLAAFESCLTCLI